MSRQALRDAKSRAHAGMKGLLDTAAAEGRGLSEEETTRYEEHKAAYGSASRTLEQIEETERIGAELDAVREPASRVPTLGAPVPAPAKKEFESLGEFMYAAVLDRDDPRLDYRSATMEMGTNSTGGFAVPTQFIDTLLQTTPSDLAIRSRATVIPAGEHPDAATLIPALDQGAGSNLYGGVTVNWIAEGDPKPETNAKLKQVSLTPQEVAGHVPITDKLLRNWRASGPLIGQLLGGAIASAEEHQFITGVGATGPTGILAAGNASLIAVNRKVANQISWDDIVELEARFKGSAGFYLASRAILPQLMTLKDGDGRLLWGNAIAGNPATLNGRQIVISDYTPALGTKGDLTLLDASYYLIKDGAPLMISASEHVKFLQNTTVIKAFKTVDGKAWPSGPFLLPSGATVSPFVTLDVPSG